MSDERAPTTRWSDEQWRELDTATRLVFDPPYPDGAVTPPLYQTSLFAFASYEEMAARFRGETTRPVYSRGDNPTVQELERKLADLEGAESARGFASGMGAISAAVLSVVQQGDRVVCVKHVYPDTYRLFQQLLPRFGVQVDYVDGTDLDAIAAALPGARLLYLESPNTLVFETQDLPGASALARQHGVTTIIDNSWATPVNQQPLSHGIDIVVHSASKYISGHSDTVAGVVVCSNSHMQRIMELTYPFLGAKMAPFEAWLLLRGLRTLSLRMARHADSARQLATKLRDHPLVQQVFQPDPAACPTLQDITGLFSFELAPTVEVAAFCNALRVFRLGVSWGGHESLAMPAKVAGQQVGGVNSLIDFSVPSQLVRLSVGLEDSGDLWTDLHRAIAAGATSQTAASGLANMTADGQT